MYDAKNKAERFCHDILQLNVRHAKALANLVMALASYPAAKSVVGLSASPLFHYQYSSITDAISHLAENKTEYQRIKQEVQQLCVKFFPWQEVYDLHQDGVPVFREHSPTLKGRGYVHKANNVIPGNKPVGLGYQYLFLNVGEAQSSWSLPFDLERVAVEQDFLTCAAAQLRRVCTDERLPFCVAARLVNAADSGFGRAKYLAPTARIPNLVNIVRLQHGMKVYPAQSQRETGGAPQVYGEELFLIGSSDVKRYRKQTKTYQKARKSIVEGPAAEFQEVWRETGRGRKLRLELRRWQDLMLRSKGGCNMKETRFDIVGVRVFDALTGKRVFPRDMFLSVVGAKRGELSLEEVLDKYRHRFDLEVTNRLVKQNLQLENYQTPDVQHLDNWVLVVQQAYWLLYAASEEVENGVSKWQKYSAPKKREGVRKTAAQTHKGSERLFLTFAKESFVPQKCQKGVGRRVGEKQAKRVSYKVVKKQPGGVKIAANEEHQE